jgi:hypothetical protein
MSNTKLLDPLGDLHSLGLKWATCAGREVLQDMDQPCLASIQTCQVLALFWFSVGQSQRNTMFSGQLRVLPGRILISCLWLGIAYKAACVLSLDNPRSAATRVQHREVSESSWLEDEIKRRCFWATWLTNCINSEHYTIGTSVNNRIMNLALPIDDLSFRTSIQVPLTTTRNSIEHIGRSIQDEPKAPPSVMAELVKLMMIWQVNSVYS